MIKILKPVLCIILTFIFGGSFMNSSLFGAETLGKEETIYKADETGCRISNIPYEEYIKEENIPLDAITVSGLSQENPGESNAALIQQYIDGATQNGGGTIVIPKGKYKTSTIELKSNVTLFIQNGAELISLSCEENEASERKLSGAVITAYGANNISVTGGGTINGMGETYTDEQKEASPLYALEKFNLYTRVIESRKRLRPAKETARSNIISFNNCNSVTLKNIILKDSAAWTCVLTDCDNVKIEDFIIDNNMHVANSDGIDILGGENILISHSFIATGDDGIVLKPIDHEIKSLTVNNCVISSFANCFKIGTETVHDITDISVKNCYFFLPDGITGGYSGIAIESADGSNISDINISDIEMDGISAPILLWLGDRMKYGDKPVGSIDSVKISNVTAENVELSSAITGCVHDGKQYDVTNVDLENINVTYRDTEEDLSVLTVVPEFSMSDYPEITRISHIYMISHEMSKYWDLPCYGIFMRYADNIKVTDFNCVPRTVNTREFLYEQKCSNVQITASNQ